MEWSSCVELRSCLAEGHTTLSITVALQFLILFFQLLIPGLVYNVYTHTFCLICHCCLCCGAWQRICYRFPCPGAWQQTNHQMKFICWPPDLQRALMTLLYPVQRIVWSVNWPLSLLYFSSCFLIILLIKLPTPLRRILSIAITNGCAAGREVPCTNNQSKYIHGTIIKYRITYSSRKLGPGQKRQIEPTRYRLVVTS